MHRSNGQIRNLCLTDEEIEEVTGRRRFRAQARVLARLGIPARHRPDGSLVVLRSVAESKLGGEREHYMTKVEPNWNAINVS